ncbi:MAG: T9SS type A sorting domain-containing protein, partial [Bacteroidia bacterium]
YPTSNYTYFEMPSSANSTPSLIRIEIGSSLYQAALPGSVLYLDKLLLKSAPTVGIIESFKNISVYSYPNPANEILNISFDGNLSGDLVLSIYDVAGKLIKKENYSNAANAVQVKTDELLSGVYFYELSNGKESVRNKFIKK